MELEVTDHPENARFEIRADGELVGFLDYRLRDGEIGLLHTETDTRFRRRGIGGRLVQSSLDSARERHLAVLPYCAFVRRWIAGHPEYADLVPEGGHQQFGLLPPRHGRIAATSAPRLHRGTDEFYRAAAFHPRESAPHRPRRGLTREGGQR